MEVLGQVFVRDTGDLEKNVYLVCGLIKTDKPLETEAVHIVQSSLSTVYQVKDCRETSEGRGLDDIMKEPLWRKFR